MSIQEENETLLDRVEGKEEENQEIEESKPNYLRDLLIVVFMIGGWVTYAEVQNQLADLYNFKHSYWLIWSINAANVIVYPCYCFFYVLTHKNDPELENKTLLQMLSEEVKEIFGSWTSYTFFSCTSTLLWVVNIYAYFLSLTMTSAASGISIFNSSAVFVYVLSVFFLREPLTIIKILSVIFGLGGVLLISFGDQSSKHSQPDELWGDLLSLVASVTFSIYMVHYSFYLVKSSYNLLMFYITCIGLFTLVFLWPVIIILDVTHYEVFALEPGPEHMWAIVFWWIVVVLDFWVSLITFIAIPITSPLFVSIANLLAIPAGLIVGYLVDVIWHQHSTNFTIMNISGSVLIFIAFIGIELHLNQPWIKKYNDLLVVKFFKSRRTE